MEILFANYNDFAHEDNSDPYNAPIKRKKSASAEKRKNDSA